MIRWFRRCCASFGKYGRQKVSFGTEAGYLSQSGLLNVFCGPESMDLDGHKPDESVETQQLAACSEFIRSLCLDPTNRPKHGPH